MDPSCAERAPSEATTSASAPMRSALMFNFHQCPTAPCTHPSLLPPTGASSRACRCFCVHAYTLSALQNARGAQLGRGKDVLPRQRQRRTHRRRCRKHRWPEIRRIIRPPAFSPPEA
eukprot:4756366-Alexandrium_andersonii.AAC.1